MADDSTPDVKRLAEEIRARGNHTNQRGNHTNQAESFAAARQLHYQCENQPAPQQFTAGIQRSKRRTMAVVSWATQVLVTVVAVAACAADVETILFTGPALTMSGLTLALLTRPLRSWSVFGYGLSGPLLAALCATLIAVFQWGPRQAEGPLLVILFAYAFASIPTALVVFPEILRWPVSSDLQMASFWQYSLKSLLLLTTALCVAVPVLRALFANVRRYDSLIFSTFVVVTMALIGLSLWMFRSGRRSK